MASKTSLLIEHWKVYLMVGGQVLEAEVGAEGGEDVAEEEATGRLKLMSPIINDHQNLPSNCA